MKADAWDRHFNTLREMGEAIDRTAERTTLAEILEQQIPRLAAGTRAYCLWILTDQAGEPRLKSSNFDQYHPDPLEQSSIRALRAKLASGTQFIYRASICEKPAHHPFKPDTSAGIVCDVVLPLTVAGEMAGIVYLLGDKPGGYPAEVRGFLSHAFTQFLRKDLWTPGRKNAASAGFGDKENIIQQIIDTDPNYIYVKDENSDFVLVNQAVANLFDTTKEEIIEKGPPWIEEHKVHVVLDRSTDRRVLEHRETVESEEQMSLASGEVRWVRTTKIPLELKSGRTHILGISVDITPIKMQAQTLEDAKQLKEQFLANISHELRTPINGIVGMVKMLESTPTLPEQKKYLEAIRKSSETLQVLINDILDFSVIESGNIRFNKIGFKPRPLITALVESFRYEARQRGLQLTLNYDPYVNEVLIGDPIRLNQILLNVLSNALKFTRKGYVRVYVLKQNDDEQKAKLKFLIEDSGIGIEKKEIGRIFDLFEQANDKISRKYGGTGLGLSIVKQLVELQNGVIEVDSDAGKGTKFSIELDFEVGTDLDLEVHAGEIPRDASNASADALQNRRVLVVEDNEVNLLYSKMLLEKWSCRVESASNGLQALELVKKTDYDVILMDMLMPVMDGEEATRFIRNELDAPKSNTRIIAITANALESDVHRYRKAGVNDCLTKPYTPDQLQAMILKNLPPGAKERPYSTLEETSSVVNLDYLKKLSDNDATFIHEMIESFKRESPKDVEVMHLATSKHNWQQVREIAHKLKPSLTFMGMNHTYQLLNDIREAAINEDGEALRRLNQSLEVAVNKAIGELNSRFPSGIAR